MFNFICTSGLYKLRIYADGNTDGTSNCYPPGFPVRSISFGDLLVINVSDTQEYPDVHPPNVASSSNVFDESVIRNGFGLIVFGFLFFI